jgi:hypothetical protein
MEITRKIFERQQQRRFGASNPERMPLEFWEWMVQRSEEARLRVGLEEEEEETSTFPGHSPYQLRVQFGQDGDYSKGPIWNFDRMGATRTPHPDGRMICIGGEHEDHYDPDFCIYNDVAVLDLDGSVAIYGYPRDVFPPTDFHSATLMGDRVIVIGRLGYPEERHPGVTPVMALDLNGYQMQTLPSQGEPPGWIFGHDAELGPNGVTVRGGEIYEGAKGNTRIRRNFDDFFYDPTTGHWKRLTNRKWRQFSIHNQERKPFMKGWVPIGLPDLSDTFIFVRVEALYPRNFKYERGCSEEFSLEDRITVDGIDVSFKFEGFDIEVMIEGDMDETKAIALVNDIKESIEFSARCSCVVESYNRSV